MGLFGEAAARFVRTSWKSTQNLAEELFSVFSSQLDLTPSSIVINQPAGATLPPIQIYQPAGSTIPGIQITKGDTVVTVGGTGGDGGGGGGVDLGDIEFPGQDPGDTVAATPPPSLNPVALHGVTNGKVGGKVYSVKCWARNPALYPPIGILQVEFPDVDVEDTIPNGVPCPVIMFLKLNGAVVQPDKSIGYVPVFITPEE